MFIDMDLGDSVTEPKPVPNGRYDLTVTEAKFNGEKNYIQVSLAIDTEPTAPNVRHFISLPKSEDDQQKKWFKRLMAKRFITQFGIPYDETVGFNVEDFPGAKASGLLTLSAPNEQGAVYNQLEVDRLPGEA